MIITKSGNILFEPTIYDKDTIQQAKLVISNFKDEPGILYRITAVLFVHNWNILSATIRTVNDKIEDIFTIEPHNADTLITKEILEKIESDLYKLLSNQIHISEYLANYPEKTRKIINSMKPYPNTEVELEPIEDAKRIKIHLKTIDRPGLLYLIAQILFLADLNIHEFFAATEDKFANDTFIVEKKNQSEFNERNLKEIKELLKKFI